MRDLVRSREIGDVYKRQAQSIQHGFADVFQRGFRAGDLRVIKASEEILQACYQGRRNPTHFLCVQ